MKKATEATSSDGKAMAFHVLCKHDLRQETIHDFVAYTMDDNCISFLGSKTELITLELYCKSSRQMPFPYVVGSWICANKERPLDQLSAQVNLQNIYENSNVLEMQQLSLESVYTAICSQDVPVPNRIAAKLAPLLLPQGHMLLATLNSYGALHLLIKTPEQPLWHIYNKGLNIANTLRDTLHPSIEVPVAKMKAFRDYQAFMDRSWITMLAWRSVNTDSYTLILGTAAGSIWTLTLCRSAVTLLAHSELQTLLGRICYLHVYDDLLLVSDNNGLVHLYKFSTANDEGLSLVKTLWLRPDRMGLQQAFITDCPIYKCYYIACCKGAHLLFWCVPKDENGKWLETRLLVGGIKITGLCALDINKYALVTARGQLHCVDLHHKKGQLITSMRSVVVEDIENDQPVGLCCSPNRNLLTILFTRNKEYLHNKTVHRNLLQVRVGKLQESNSLLQLVDCLSPSTPMNNYIDLLVELRLHIFQSGNLDEYINYSPLYSFAFDGEATDSQLQLMQIKYQVLKTVMEAQSGQRNQYLLEQCEQELELLLAMLRLTHIRLRLQFLCRLKELSTFQRQSAQYQLAESVRIRQQLKEKPVQEHAVNVIIKRFLSQMEVHFDLLQLKINVPEVVIDDSEQLCTISYVPLEPSLERRFCTLCGRVALLDGQLLQELYAPDRLLLCPCCHGSYALELLNA